MDGLARPQDRRNAQGPRPAPGRPDCPGWLDREARILEVEQALIAGELLAAAGALDNLAAAPLTARLAGLRARVAGASARPDRRGPRLDRPRLRRGASGEPDWSDIDPADGPPAFVLAKADWARLIAAYAEGGLLLHPRFERAEAEIRDLPSLPAAYVDSAAFVSAAAAGEAWPPIVDDGEFGEALPAGRRRGPRGGEPARAPSSAPLAPAREAALGMAPPLGRLSSAGRAAHS